MPDTLTLYIGDTDLSELTFWVKDYFNSETCYFEKVELLGSAQNLCEGCGKKDTELRFKANSKGLAGTHTVVLRVFDTTS